MVTQPSGPGENPRNCISWPEGKQLWVFSAKYANDEWRLGKLMTLAEFCYFVMASRIEIDTSSGDIMVDGNPSGYLAEEYIQMSKPNVERGPQSVGGHIADVQGSTAVASSVLLNDPPCDSSNAPVSGDEGVLENIGGSSVVDKSNDDDEGKSVGSVPLMVDSDQDFSSLSAHVIPTVARESKKCVGSTEKLKKIPALVSRAWKKCVGSTEKLKKIPALASSAWKTCAASTEKLKKIPALVSRAWKTCTRSTEKLRKIPAFASSAWKTCTRSTEKLSKWQRKATEQSPAIDTGVRVTVNGVPSALAAWGASALPWVQNAFAGVGTVLPAALPVAGVAVDLGNELKRVAIREGTRGEKQKEIDQEWTKVIDGILQYLINARIIEDSTGAKAEKKKQLLEMRKQYVLQEKLKLRDAELINEESEQNLVKGLHKCTIFTLSDIPDFCESVKSPGLCADWCFVKAVKICQTAAIIQQQAAQEGIQGQYWKKFYHEFSSLSEKEFIALADHAASDRADSLQEVCVAYARFVTRQKEDRRAVSRFARNAAISSVLSLASGNPLPAILSGVQEGCKGYLRSKERRGAFLRIDKRGRLVGKDGTEDLLDPKYKQSEEIFFSMEGLAHAKAGTDLKEKPVVADYYTQIEHLLRGERLHGYRDAGSLAGEAQLRLLKMLTSKDDKKKQKIYRPVIRLGKDAKEALNKTIETLSETTLPQLRGEEAQLESQLQTADDEIRQQNEILMLVISDSFRTQQVEAKIRSANQSRATFSRQLTTKKDQIRAVQERLDKLQKKIDDDAKLYDRVNKPPKEELDVHTLDHDHDFEEAFCIWVQNHLVRTPGALKSFTGYEPVRVAGKELLLVTGSPIVGGAAGMAGGAVLVTGAKLLSAAGMPLIGAFANMTVGLGFGGVVGLSLGAAYAVKRVFKVSALEIIKSFLQGKTPPAPPPAAPPPSHH